MRGILKASTAHGAMMLALFAMPAWAQQVDSKTTAKTQTRANTRINTSKQSQATKEADATVAPVTEGAEVTDDGTANDIVVIGVKGAIDSAIARKRNNSQIVDSVVAEDAGKLPDNNVAEAVARVPGVNISRSQGQGGSITIRGLQGVQTTINGQDVAVGENRGLNLSDVPAELVKAIDVYKSRSAAQPEGGSGGTVNIELRRPLDLKMGLLVAGSLRGNYNDVAKKTSPFASLLVGYRFETGLGEMGILLNGGYAKTYWSEALIQNESPGTFYGQAQASLPANVRDTAVAPYRIQYGLNSGVRTQPSLSATYQWRPSSNLNFVLEGQYIRSDSQDRYSGLNLFAREGNYTLSNVVLLPSGAIDSATYTGRNPNGNGQVTANIPAQIFASVNKGKSETTRGNFEAHWAAGIARIDFSASYDRFRGYNYSTGTGRSFAGASVANVNFNNPLVKGGIPTFTLQGIDFNNPAQATLSSFSDNSNVNNSDIFVAQADTTLNVSESGFLRQFLFGFRYSDREEFRSYGYRNVRWDDPTRRPPISALGGPIISLTPTIGGISPITYATIDPQWISDNFDKLKGTVIGLNPDGFDGNGPQTSVAAFLAPDRPTIDRLQGATFKENIFAFYGQANWALNIGFPVDGQVGVRYVNTYGGNQGAQLVIPSNPNGTCCGASYIVDNSARGNAVDLLPSASAIWHFASNLQLRTTYNLNVQRPSFYALRSTIIIVNPANLNEPIFAGNPDLKPYRDNNFNASLEWFPRPGVSITTGAFYKKQTGFIYYTRGIEPVPQLNNQERIVFKERNAGPGRVLGFEGALTSPFFFAPGLLKNFGVSANVTFIPTAELDVPNDDRSVFTTVRASFTSKWTTNIILFYETPKFSTRVAYNWRSNFKTSIDANNPQWISVGLPQERLEAAINYTPVRFLTLSIEGTNLTRTLDRYRYDQYPDLSAGLRSMARTVQASARFRF